MDLKIGPRIGQVEKQLAAEMKFLRYVVGYTLKDQVRNDNIRQQLGIFHLNDRIQ
jgi:hypothetical protein